MGVSAEIESFRIDVPASWQELPLDLPSLRATLAGAQGGEEWERVDSSERRRIDLYLQRLLVDIESVDARYVAVYSELIEADGEVVDDVPLAASCVVSIVDRASLGSELPLTTAVIQAAMSVTPPDKGVLARERSTNLAEPTIVQLEHITAVKVCRLLEMRYSARETISVANETYFVPLPDEFERVIVIQFSTPNIEDAEIFSDLFAAIAGTVTIYREGEEAVL